MIKIGNKTVLDIGIGGKAVQKVEIGDKIAYEMPDYLCFTDVSGAANTLSLTRTGDAPVVSLEYSTDKVNWNIWTAENDVRTLTIPANGKVWLRGDNTAFGYPTQATNRNVFSSTGDVNASGNIMTLLDKTGASLTAGQYAFFYLFYNWKKLKTAPSFPATNVGQHAYHGTFQSSGITISPDLPATALDVSSYYDMFANCTSLTTGSHISYSNRIPNQAFREMYYGCTALTTVYELNSTEIGDHSCNSMFRNTALTTGLDLRKVTSIGANAINNMYADCPNITTVYAPTVTWDTSKASNWLNNVAASGTLYADDSVAGSITRDSVSGCPTGWSVAETHTYLCFTDVSGSANTLSLTKTGTPQSVSLEYSTDKNTWNTWTETEGVRSVTIPANGRVWLRGDNSNGFAVDNSNYFKFASTGDVNADGDLMRIINKNGSNTVPAYAFCNMFNAMNTLKKAPAINATSYGSYCCRTTFNGCRNLNDISNFKIINPSFPDNSSYQFYGTFLGCWGLTTVDVFNGSTVVCSTECTYNQMFAFCNNLTTAPEFTIGSNTGQGAFNGMFQSCIALNDISNIHFSATSIENGMFRYTFTGCTSLVSGLDIRSATILQNNGLTGMYNGCSSLTTAYAPTVTWNTAKSGNWLNGVAASGTLYADSSISSTIPTDSVDGCPSGWTVQNI